MYPIVFLHDNSENNLREVALKYWASIEEDLDLFAYGPSHADRVYSIKEDSDLTEKEQDELISKSEDLGDSDDWGYGFGYTKGTGPNEDTFWGLTLAGGGPSAEIRFYEDDSVVFVYMDWCCGIGLNITDTQAAVTLRDYYEDIMEWGEDY